MALPTTGPDPAKQSKADWFGKFAARASMCLGSRWAFTAAVLVIVVWSVTGPIYRYSDTWQLVINTGTTIVPFPMVFLIQNTQNRGAKAINLKLNELIWALEEISARYENIRIAYQERQARKLKAIC